MSTRPHGLTSLKAEVFKSDVPYAGSSFVRKYKDDGLVAYYSPLAWDSRIPFCLPSIMLGLISTCSLLMSCKMLVTFMHTRVNLLTPWCRVLPAQLVKKLPAFHGTLRFITALTSVRHLSLSWTSPIQSTSHLLEIHPNIIHPSTPRSPQWSLSLRFPH